MEQVSLFIYDKLYQRIPYQYNEKDIWESIVQSDAIATLKGDFKTLVRDIDDKLQNGKMDELLKDYEIDVDQHILN